MTHSGQHRRQPELRGRPGLWWYPLVTLLSVGLLSWLPSAHAAIRLRSRARAVEAAVHAALAVLSLVLFSTAPVDAAGDPVGAGVAEWTLGMITLIGLVAIGSVRDWVLLLRTRPRDPAIAAVLGARSKREQAREIVAQDPLLAHDLRIGRPDLRIRRYDDGGLVDLNSAGIRAIADTCEVSPAVARAIADARPESGFLAVDDVFVLVDVPLDRWSLIRDRAVVIVL